jgi:hypothetical protein
MSGMRRYVEQAAGEQHAAALVEHGNVAGAAGVAEVQHLHRPPDQVQPVAGFELLVGLVHRGALHRRVSPTCWRSAFRQVSQREAISRAVRLCMRIGMPRSRKAAPPNRNSGRVWVTSASFTGSSVVWRIAASSAAPCSIRGAGVDRDDAGLADDEAGIADAPEVVSSATPPLPGTM